MACAASRCTNQRFPASSGTHRSCTPKGLSKSRAPAPSCVATSLDRATPRVLVTRRFVGFDAAFVVVGFRAFDFFASWVRFLAGIVAPLSFFGCASWVIHLAQANP